MPSWPRSVWIELRENLPFKDGTSAYFVFPDVEGHLNPNIHESDSNEGGEEDNEKEKRERTNARMHLAAVRLCEEHVWLKARGCAHVLYMLKIPCASEKTIGL